MSSLLGSLSQPATTISISTKHNVFGMSIISRDGFAAGSRGECPERRVGHCGFEECDMPVGEQKIRDFSPISTNPMNSGKAFCS